MRRLLLLLVIGGGLVTGDLLAKARAEDKMAERIEASVPGDERADVAIDSFPFLARLLVAGSAGDLRARVDQVAEPIGLAAVEIRLSGVRVDRDLLFDRVVSVTDIGSGTASADLTAGVLGGLAKLPVTVRDGRVELTVAGVTVAAEASVVDDRLRLAVPPLPPVTVPLPSSSLLPCVTDAIVLADRIRVSCTLDDVPPALLRAARDVVGAG